VWLGFILQKSKVTFGSQAALIQCHGRNLMACMLHPMLRTSAEITCEAAFFLNDKKKIKAKCRNENR
jgi:hypothetical protein